MKKLLLLVVMISFPFLSQAMESEVKELYLSHNQLSDLNPETFRELIKVNVPEITAQMRRALLKTLEGLRANDRTVGAPLDQDDDFLDNFAMNADQYQLQSTMSSMEKSIEQAAVFDRRNASGEKMKCVYCLEPMQQDAPDEFLGILGWMVQHKNSCPLWRIVRVNRPASLSQRDVIRLGLNRPEERDIIFYWPYTSLKSFYPYS